MWRSSNIWEQHKLTKIICLTNRDWLEYGDYLLPCGCGRGKGKNFVFIHHACILGEFLLKSDKNSGQFT